jgi:hypothetical protein
VSYPQPYDPNQNLGYQQPFDQPPYAQQQQPYYQQPQGPVYQQSQGPVQDHPQASTALVLGILGLYLCGVLAPFALMIGRRTIREIDASGGQYGGRSAARAGHILGIVGTVLLCFAVLATIAYVIFVIALVGSFANST